MRIAGMCTSRIKGMGRDEEGIIMKERKKGRGKKRLR